MNEADKIREQIAMEVAHQAVEQLSQIPDLTLTEKVSHRFKLKITII